jgi:hypothetical protein
MKKIFLLSGLIGMCISLQAQGKKDNASSAKVTITQPNVSIEEKIKAAPLLKSALKLSSDLGFEPSGKIDLFYTFNNMEGLTKIYQVGEYFQRRTEALSNGEILSHFRFIEKIEGEPLRKLLRKDEFSKQEIFRYSILYNGESEYMDVLYLSDLGIVIFNLVPQNSDNINTDYWVKLLATISESDILANFNK